LSIRRHCEERSDEAIQRARSAQTKKSSSGGDLGVYFARLPARGWIASLRSQ
jgi:hypothetical protein